MTHREQSATTNMTYLKTIWINLWILDLLITNSHWWLDNSKVLLIVKGLVQRVRILISRECENAFPCVVNRELEKPKCIVHGLVISPFENYR